MCIMKNVEIVLKKGENRLVERTESQRVIKARKRIKIVVGEDHI